MQLTATNGQTAILQVWGMNQAMDSPAASACSAGQPSAQVFRFSTADYAPQDRLAAWREVLCRSVHLRLDVEPVDDAPPRATVELHRWLPTALYFSETFPVRASRTPTLVQNGDGDFRLLRAEGAGFRFTSRGVDAAA